LRAAACNAVACPHLGAERRLHRAAAGPRRCVVPRAHRRRHTAACSRCVHWRLPEAARAPGPVGSSSAREGSVDAFTGVNWIGSAEQGVPGVGSAISAAKGRSGWQMQAFGTQRSFSLIFLRDYPADGAAPQCGQAETSSCRPDVRRRAGKGLRRRKRKMAGWPFCGQVAAMTACPEARRSAYEDHAGSRTPGRPSPERRRRRVRQ
jgi:hypothetical protein